MSRYQIDTVLRVRLEHQPGRLAGVATAIATQRGLLGDITTVSLGDKHSLRDITVESRDEQHTALIIEAIGAVAGVEILGVTDRTLSMHEGGKLHSTSRVRLEVVEDLRAIYTPGVARVAKSIQKDPMLAWTHTSLGNSVGIFTNGTRVLGLGNVGTLASLPVMEGKAVLYDKFAGISATPILVDTLDVDTFVDTVVRISGGFGGIHLEDIRIPDCFAIEDRLDEALGKPVMHDDQHGTAVVALAAIITACNLTGTDLRRARVGQIGLGAAGSAIAKLALAYGVGEVLVTDLDQGSVARLVAAGARAADFGTVMKESQVVVATTGKPGLIGADMVQKGQVIFALSNPNPEIHSEDALAAGAAFASDGRAVNNALAFPGLFRAALDVRSHAITREMKIAAAEAIAGCTDPGEVSPNPLSLDVHRAVAAAVAAKAREQGLADTLTL